MNGGGVFDSGKASTFSPSQVIKGWRIVMESMHIGYKWEIVLPSELGYSDGKVRIFTMKMLRCEGVDSSDAKNKVHAVKSFQSRVQHLRHALSQTGTHKTHA